MDCLTQEPKNLSIVQGLGFIPASHCAHYHSQPTRKPIYFDDILKEKMPAGYAIDDSAGVVFVNEKYTRAVSLNKENNAYYISVSGGSVFEKLLPTLELLK